MKLFRIEVSHTRTDVSYLYGENEADARKTAQNLLDSGVLQFNFEESDHDNECISKVLGIEISKEQEAEYHGEIIIAASNSIDASDLGL
jgi:hypothetical protein